MRFSARIFGVLLSFLIVLFVSKMVFAQTNYPQQESRVNFQASNLNSDVPRNLHTWTQVVMLEVGSAMTCQLIGADPLSPTGKCLGVDPTTGEIGYVDGNGGAVGVLGRMITYLYIPPVQPDSYINYLSRNFGIVKPSYAQGVGYNQLSPVMNLWIQFRNIAYLLFILIFVIVGIAIMLRIRIDPRTVMTVQNQIPKLVIGIVLITFSYAIAGFLVDLMWVSSYASFQIITKADSRLSDVDLPTAISQPTLPAFNYMYQQSGGLANVASKAGNSIGEMVRKLFEPIAPNQNNNNPPAQCGGPLWLLCNVTNWAGSVVDGILKAASNPSAFFAGVVAGVASTIVQFIAMLIFIIAILWALIRLWLSLLKAYITILFDVIFAPFWILGGLLPGVTAAGFGNWLRDLLGNLAAFPAVIILFTIGRVFVDNFQSGSSGASFVPPFIGTNITNLVGALIALGIILISPEIVNITKKAFKSSGVPVPMGGISTGQEALAAVGGAVAGRMYYRNRNGELSGPVGTLLSNRVQSLTQSRNRVARWTGKSLNVMVRPTMGNKPGQTSPGAGTAGTENASGNQGKK